MAGEVIGPRGELTIVVSLNGHAVKLLSKYTFILIDLCCFQLRSEKFLFAAGSG